MNVRTANARDKNFYEILGVESSRLSSFATFQNELLRFFITKAKLVHPSREDDGDEA